MSDLLQRPALYYPYIHIRSEHWLKATLLCAPAVKRMVPEGYTPEDLPNIVKYTQIKGPGGELLQSVPAYSPAADNAQQRLLEKLRLHEKAIRSKFDRNHSPVPDEYWIHDAKFNGNLLRHLVAKNLAWSSHDPSAYGHRAWFALHPVLGSAIMTTLGLGVASDQHYDIVTNSTDFHETLLATQEDEIFEALLRSNGKQTKPRATKGQVRRDLGQLVITLTGVNYQALRAEDIPELQQSENFQEFRKLIRGRAQGIDLNDDSEAYSEQLKREAEDIVDAWHSTKSSLGSGLRDIVFAQGCTYSVDALKTHLKHSPTTMTDLLVAGGVAVGLLVLKGWRVREEQRHSPYQYLTKLVKAEVEFL